MEINTSQGSRGRVRESELMFVGSHIGSSGGLINSMKRYIEDKIITRRVPMSFENPDGKVSIVPPIQILLRAYHINSGTLMSDREVALIRDLVECYKLRLFIHSPFTINLSSKDRWCLGILEADLKLGNQLSCSGVVVHVGTAGESSDEEATDLMYTGIRQVLKLATERCPLLLETPAGEGTEICTVLEEMITFFNRFSDDEKKLIKVCIDTAHIWGAGYEPMDYIGKWIDYHGICSVGLVHYNDSKVPLGARVQTGMKMGKMIVAILG